MVSLNLISEASVGIRSLVRQTPVEESPLLSKILGVPVWLKLENLQVTGSFKARGALFSLLKARQEGLQHVATCSAGNHGKGVAWAAHTLQMKATIFVPSSVDTSKLEGMQTYGADVRVSEFPGYDATEAWAKSECDRLGFRFVSAYDDAPVMAANGGTLAVEILEQVPDVTSLVLPVGGGGLSAGAAYLTKELRPNCQIVVCQHEESPAFLRSIEAGEAVLKMPPVQTLASGLEGGFGLNTFEVLKNRYDHIRLVSETEIRSAMVWMIRHHQWIVEGSAAVVIAACLQPDFPKPRGPVVFLISGRNVAISTIVDVLSEGA